MNIGKAIVDLRHKHGLSQERLAYEAEISRHYMYKLEKNKASPTVSMLEKIARVLNVAPWQILKKAESLD